MEFVVGAGASGTVCMDGAADCCCCAAAGSVANARFACSKRMETAALVPRAEMDLT